MKRIKRKALCLLATCPLLMAGPCAIESWNLALGPVFSGDTAYAGVELEFANGFDFVVPLVRLGDLF